MITLRKPQEIHQAGGEVQHGTFNGRWHFSFDDYADERFIHFGNLRVFNDDTLSAGAVWPLHPHRNIEVVTYCAGGEFRHADEHGKGGVLLKGWVQHTTVGRGMWHSELNNRPDTSMRFIQMWFVPTARDLDPSVEQRAVDASERTNRMLVLVSPRRADALPIASDAEILACRLQSGKTIKHSLATERGAYLYALEGGPISLNGHHIPELGAAMITEEQQLTISAENDAELLMIDVAL